MTIETITPAEATEQLRAAGMKISATTLRDGIEQGKYPFGICIVSKSGGKVYQIYKRLFDSWMLERSSEVLQS